MKRWSTREVARLAGVSAATVSRVLNSRSSVAPELAHRVRQVIHGLEGGNTTGTPRQAPGLRIGIAFPRRLEGYDSDPTGGAFYGQVLSGIDEVLQEGNHSHSLVPYDPQEDPERFSARNGERFDALLLMGADTSEEVAREAQRQGLPVMVVDKQVRGVDSVVSDNVGGAAEVTSHVIGAGYRRLVYVCETLADPSFAARRMGFEQAVAAADNPEIATSVAQLGRGWLDAPSMLGELYGCHNEPVCIVAGNDMTALHMLAMARARGIRVPEELGLAGFDDVILASKSEPSLTTVRVDKVEMGRLAARRLLERLTLPDLLPITIIMHVALMVRQSTDLGGTRSN